MVVSAIFSGSLCQLSTTSFGRSTLYGQPYSPRVDMSRSLSYRVPPSFRAPTPPRTPSTCSLSNIHGGAGAVPATTPDRDTGRPPSCTRIRCTSTTPRSTRRPYILSDLHAACRGRAPCWPRSLRGCVRTTRRWPWPWPGQRRRARQTRGAGRGAARARLEAGPSRRPGAGGRGRDPVAGKTTTRALVGRAARKRWQAISTNLADGRVVLDNVSMDFVGIIRFGCRPGSCVVCKALAAACMLRPKTHPSNDPTFHLPRPHGHVGSIVHVPEPLRLAYFMTTHCCCQVWPLSAADDDWEKLVEVCSRH